MAASRASVIDSSSRPSSVLKVTFHKCGHYSETRHRITSFSNEITFLDIFNQNHELPPGGRANECLIMSDKNDIQPNLTVGEAVTLFSMRNFEFTCTLKGESLGQQSNLVVDVAEKSTKETVNAFQLLMAGGRALPSKKRKSSGLHEGVSRKDELYNKLIEDFFNSKKLDLPRPVVETEGHYIVQVLCNALWYITNHHGTISDAAQDRKAVSAIPEIFHSYQGFNEVKRKKMKEMQLDVKGLESQSEALYSILLKPVTSSTAAWKDGAEEIRGLADCLHSYKEYLTEKTNEIKKNHLMDHPVRTIAKDATIEHRSSSNIVYSKYDILDRIMKEKAENELVFFNEMEHVEQPFKNTTEKFRFLRDLKLSVPILIVRFSPGGSTGTTVVISKAPLNYTDPEIFITGARLLQQARPKLLEVHTREMKRTYKQKINNITSLSPSILEFIYKELAFDGSKATNPVIQERLRLISLGHTDLIADLRHTNPGRPNNKFDIFFDQLGAIVEDITAADDRRHGQAHLSEFISIPDLIKQATSKCPLDTPIPSASLVRLQFHPRNPYCKGALNFTSRLDVQFKIQRRQLRLSHPDSHYCNAQFKYLKSYAVEENDKCMLVFCDDKAKVPIGEPGTAISTVVRGKKSIVPTTSTLVALDHDMTRSSITPSVVLQCSIPDKVETSFVRGKVVTVINDSVFQAASPFRHATVLSKMMENSDKSILFKFTDGGVDQRNNLESVKLANVCLFKEHNLDFLVHGRCAPGQSYTNPAERIMSILNLGLQNVSLERLACETNVENILKRKNSMAEIRVTQNDMPNLKIIEEWTESLEPVKRTIMNRFIRLSLKDEPIQVMEPVSDEEIDILKHHIREMFPTIDLNKLQKAHTNKVRSYQDWLEKHSKSSHYIFQLKKCSDENCCLPPKYPLPSWLPDPVLDESGNHYKPYSEVKGQETTEKDRPSLKPLKKTKQKSKIRYRKSL